MKTLAYYKYPPGSRTYVAKIQYVDGYLLFNQDKHTREPINKTHVTRGKFREILKDAIRRREEAVAHFEKEAAKK